MKKLLYIALMMVLAGTLSCHRTSDVEARLIAIDSIIADAPDSALSLLEAIDSSGESPGTKGLTPASRMTQSERAYHALLTVQTLYKAYIPATSDSLINLAWDYYKDHGPYNRRIRAMLYKGTTAEELGHPDSAMRWYKRTELESRPDDHYHRAYTLMKMGNIYQQCYYYTYAIKHYREALSNLDSSLIAISTYCTQQLGQLYLEENLDSARYFINQISRYVQDTNDSIYMLSNMLNKSMMWFYNEQYDSAKDEAVAAIRLFNDKVPYTGWYDLIISYSKLNELDSAEYYFSLMPYPVTSKDSAFYYEILQALCKGQEKWKAALKYEEHSNITLKNILSTENGNALIQVEHHVQTEYESQNNNRSYLVFAIVALLVSFVVLFLISNKRKHKTEKFAEKQIAWLNAQYNESKSIIEGLQNENERLKSLQSDSEIMKLVNVQFKVAFQNCIQRLGDIATDYYEHGENATDFIGRFKTEFDTCWKSQDFWTAMENHINASRNNVISRLKDEHPDITISELRLTMLVILDFDPMAIAICMGYKNTNVLYAMKNKLKRKLKTNYKTLEEYLEAFI